MLEPEEGYEDEEVLVAGFRLNADKRESVWLNHNSETREFLRSELPDVGGFAWNTSDTVSVFSEGGYFEFTHGFRGTGHHTASDGAILSPMPGRIISVDVAVGDSVTKGQKLLTLEAMKMEHTLTAPFDGVVAELNAEAGAQVQVEALLAKIEVEDDK